MKKKWISMLLLLCMAVPIVAACGIVEPPVSDTTTGSAEILETTAAAGEMTTAPEETTENTSKLTETTAQRTEGAKPAETEDGTITITPTVNPLESAYKGASYRTLTELVPYEDGIMVLANRKLRYYNIAEEKLYLLCRDPACEHTDYATCISEFFAYNRTLSFWTSNMVYSEHDGRFYLPRGQQLYSFASDGSDLKLEHSFGDIGEASQARYQNTYLVCFTAYENYIYFIYYTPNERKALYRYDTDTDELTHLHEDKDMDWYVIADDMLWYSYDSYVAVSNVDGTHSNTRGALTDDFIHNAIYHNGALYSVMYEYDEQGEFSKACIVSFDVQTGKRDTIFSSTAIGCELLAVTDTMIYYKEERYDGSVFCIPIEGGNAKTALPTISWHQEHIVYRPAYESNSDDIFVSWDIYFLSADQVIICGYDSEYTPLYLADVKEDGTFTNLQKVEMDGDRYHPAEPLEQVEITPAEEQVSEHLDDFKEFHFLTNGAIRLSKNMLYDDMYEGMVAIQYRVLGIDHVEDPNYTYYRIQILHVYGMDEGEYDKEKTYLLRYGGTPELPYYNRPALEIGKDYLAAANANFAEREYLSMTPVLSLSYEDGKTYVYSTNYDLCGLICAEKITDPEENQIFKADIHAKYIAAANARALGLETYDYKCELYAMLAEVWEIE